MKSYDEMTHGEKDQMYQKLVEKFDANFAEWKLISDGYYYGVSEETIKQNLERMHQLSKLGEMLKKEMEPYRPTRLVCWLDILPYLPVTDVEGNVITHASLRRNKSMGGPNKEEHVVFHYVRPDGSKFILHEPNKMSVLAHTWAVYLKREEAERIGITRDLQTKDRLHNDERPAVRDSVQTIIY